MNASFKRAAWLHGVAKRGSVQEERARQLLLEVAAEELVKRGAERRGAEHVSAAFGRVMAEMAGRTEG